MMYKNLIDMTGLKFDRLLVLSLAYTKNKKSYWNCICDCGVQKIIRQDSLKSGRSKSCGCLNKERPVDHGLSGSKIYHVWASMKNRCNNSNDTNYEYYGGRGVSVYSLWNKRDGFINFYKWAIQNGYEKGLTLDRIDVNGNYEPDNCRWITHKKQMLNTRRNKRIKYKNELKTLSEWAQTYNLKFDTLYARVNHGWTIERALTTPVKSKV